MPSDPYNPTEQLQSRTQWGAAPVGITPTQAAVANQSGLSPETVRYLEQSLPPVDPWKEIVCPVFNTVRPHPEDTYSGMEFIYEGITNENLTAGESAWVIGGGVFTVIMGVFDIIDFVPDPSDAVQRGVKKSVDVVIDNARRRADDALESGAKQVDCPLNGDHDPHRIYSTRELLRRAEDTGPNHNFPEAFNKEIFKGTRQQISDNYVLYTKRGHLNGRPGTYEIGVRPSPSKRNEVITHRVFVPDRKTKN